MYRALAAKNIAGLVLIAVIGFTLAFYAGLAAIRAAHGEEASGAFAADVSPGLRWVTVITIQAKNGETIKLSYGTKETGKALFKSKEDCDANKKTDDRLLEAITKLMVTAAERGDVLKSLDCVLDNSGEDV
jgi:hypothetical protein